MLRLIKFLFLALAVGLLVFWVTFNYLKSKPQELEYVENEAVVSSPTPTFFEVIPTVRDQVKIQSNLINTVLNIGAVAQISGSYREFVIRSSPITTETVLGYTVEIGSNSEFSGEKFNEILSYFLENNFIFIHKEEFYESDPLTYFEEYLKEDTNCFLHTYESFGEIYIDVGCNSEV